MPFDEQRRIPDNGTTFADNDALGSQATRFGLRIEMIGKEKGDCPSFENLTVTPRGETQSSTNGRISEGVVSSSSSSGFWLCRRGKAHAENIAVRSFKQRTHLAARNAGTEGKTLARVKPNELSFEDWARRIAREARTKARIAEDKGGSMKVAPAAALSELSIRVND